MTRKEKFKIRSSGVQDKQAWDTYVLSHPNGLAYHLFAWKEAVEQAYGFDCPYFVAEMDAQICGLLPTAHIHWPLRSGSLVSLPYCDIGGILADSAEIAEALLAHVLDYAQKCSIPCIELRSGGGGRFVNWNTGVLGGEEGDDWIRHNNQSTNISSISNKPIPQSTNISNTPPTKVRMLLSLPETSKVLMASFKSKLRSQVKKPSRDGLTSVLGGAELINDFYAVFAENMRDLGSPVHSRKWIQSVLQAYGSRARCGLVYMPDGSPAACGIILLHDRTVSIPWASALRRFNRYSPNMLLYWSFLEYAADNGYAFFDFGRSTPGEGTYKFKTQWGAKPQPLHWMMIETQSGTAHSLSVPDTQESSQDRCRKLAEKAFQSMPIPLAMLVGCKLRKYISL
ncbi:MAG: GNAT family N-acetyltransferase [Desulfovermiculus sp.]|nr:GNAT family N-acetyltransferase [Desulfovermiculus sp.]